MVVPRPLPKANTPAEVELHVMWEDAQSEFRQMTKKSLMAYPEKQLKDVVQELERKFQPKAAEDRSTKSRVRDTMIKILDCVQLLGGIAAQSVSIVFGPATLCFNAFSFLIEAPGKVAAVYEGVGKLFEEIAHFIILFQIYGNYTTIDPELRDSTHKIMVSLVRICGLAIKLIDGGIFGQFKVGLKVTFLNDDSGVKDELARFKALIENQSHITEAITLEHVLSTEEKTVELLKAQYLYAEKLTNVESGVNVLVADMKDRKTERLVLARAEKIAKVLSIRHESCQEAKLLVQKMQDNLLEGSSQWLFDHPDYKEWSSLRTDSDPLLLLSGDAKTGKSFLLASIDRNLGKTSPGVVVAYHAFVGRDGKASRDKSDNDLAVALKSMALQVASQNKTYANEIEGMKETDFKVSETLQEAAEGQLWTKLKFTADLRSKDVNLVLMFDGLDELSGNTARKFLEQLRGLKSHRFRPRIVATGKQVTFQGFSDMTNIDVAENNESDMSLFLEQELRKDEVLQGQHVEMTDLLESIRKDLPRVAEGSFSNVQQKLARLGEAVESDAYLDDLTRIIEQDPAKDLDKIAQKIISDCHASCNPHDVEQLNEILSWTIFGRTYFQMDELRAILFLSSGRSPLQPIGKKLRKKYGKIFNVNDALVSVNVAVEDHLLQASKNRASSKVLTSDLSGAKITMTVSIDEADLRTTQQFCWDLTERVGIGRFDFFTASAESTNKAAIRCDKARSHHRIAEQLLKLLNDEPHEKTRVLVSYALDYLPLHLQQVSKALNEGTLEKGARRVIAKGLVDLLSDVDAIKEFWNVCPSESEWIGEEAVNTIRELLTDEQSLAVLEPKERRWVRHHTTESENQAGFYKPLTLLMCRRWLQDRTWNPRNTFFWICGYIGLQKPKDDDGGDGASNKLTNDRVATNLLAAATVLQSDISNLVASPSTASEVPMTSIQQHEKVVRAANWARQQLGAGEEDSLWCERIGQTCYMVNEYHTAMEWYERARSLHGCHWTVHEGQALVYAALGKLDDACREMEIAISELRRRGQSDPPATNTREDLVRDLKELASWQTQLDRKDYVFDLYGEILNLDPTDYDIRCDLVRFLYKSKREDEARSTLLDLDVSEDESVDFTSLTKLIQSLAADEVSSENLDFVVGLAQTDARLSRYAQLAFNDAIDDARKNDLVVNRAVLLLHQGLLVCRDLDGVQLQHAVRLWEECQSLRAASYWGLYRTHSVASRQVAQHHVHKVMNPNITTAMKDYHFNKLLKMCRTADTETFWFSPTSLLASCYVHRDQQEEARKLFMDDVMEGLVILSDNDPDNDVVGYKLLAQSLMHAGDDLDALSAWSMLGPHGVFASSGTDTVAVDEPEVAKNAAEADGLQDVAELEQPPERSSDATSKSETETLTRTGPLTYLCDGRCDHEWGFADDIYCCRFCPDTQFTRDCLEKLTAGKLLRSICHRDHSWLHVPAWSDEEARRVGQGNVRAGGTLVDGKRVGGEVVKIEEWLDRVREGWGIPKTVVEAAA